MIINLIKYYSFLSLVIIPITMSANDITMPPDEVLKMPLPLPYNGEIYSESDIERFLDSDARVSSSQLVMPSSRVTGPSVWANSDGRPASHSSWPLGWSTT